MPDITREALADLAEECEADRWDEWHAVYGRCGRTAQQCCCFTTADLYVVDGRGLCQPDPEAF